MSINKLKQAFATALEIPEHEINTSLNYAKHPKWDSTGHMILIAELENSFDVMLDTDDIIDMSSYSKAQEILAKYDISFNEQ
ncbi:acyl carrier protein [Colwellia sp. M166]|mgnify:CR=1 FL=1|uniref:acyl carrier protein n=1 Tax=Colwellia sp. M166 TaxID=2583805 RepID=UPI00211E48F3|nr:acyl carrier protein [Colwellia sp. M166]UUO23112.1 acyl carrier protein [Colwellia sp. M166]